MRKLTHLELAKIIYKPTLKQENLVVKIASIMDKHNVKQLDFPKPLKVASLRMTHLERENSHSMLLAHWAPQLNVSTKTDPFCSLFILHTLTLQRIYKYVLEHFGESE